MQVPTPPLFEPLPNPYSSKTSSNMTLIGCLWVATFQLCLQSISHRTSSHSRGRPLPIASEQPEEIVATLEDSGEKLILSTMADSNRETSATNISTFAELLKARGDPDKILRMGRKIAGGTLAAYLRKKVEQLYALDMILQHEIKSSYELQTNLSLMAQSYFQSGDYNDRWTLALSYTILINFGFDGRTHILFSNAHLEDPEIEPGSTDCNSDEVYDPVNKKCRIVTCDAGYKYIDGLCQHVTGNGSSLPVPPSSENTPVSDSLYSMRQIVLQANVTLSTYITTLAAEFKPMMIESLSELLNISADQIRNFTIVTMNEPKRVVKHKIPQRYFGVNMDSINDGVRSFESTSVSEPGISSKPESETNTIPTTEERISLEISFVLVPPNETSTGKSVSTIVHQMDDLIQHREFTFNVNETWLTVVGLKNEQEPPKPGPWCEHGAIRYYKSNQFSMIDVKNPHDGTQLTESIYVNETDTSYGTGQFDLTIYVHSSLRQSEPNVSAIVAVCDSPTIKDKSCGRVSLDSGEYTILPNLSLVFGPYLFGLDEYQNLNGKIEICLPSTMKYQSLGVVSRGCINTSPDLFMAQIVLTQIVGILSLVAMFVVLVTYMLFSKLRNIPGINTMNLTISLFCSELIFLIFGSVNSDVVCKAVAISLHYFFLSSFFWMNVMAYDLFCTFGRANILPWPRSKTKVIPRYLLYAWGSPVLIVGACIAIDLSHIFPSVRVGYGGSDQVDTYHPLHNETGAGFNGTGPVQPDGSTRRLGCWIQDPLASLIAFGVPLICIVLVNAVLFTKTIINIRRTIKTINLRLNHQVSGRKDVVLYVRMSVVMGFTWILGLGSSFVSSGAHPSYTMCLLLNIVGLFFIIFNCSQGLFICFVFVLNRRVGGYYKGLWKEIGKRLPRGNVVISHISLETGSN